MSFAHDLPTLLSCGRTQYADGRFNQALETWRLATEVAQTLSLDLTAANLQAQITALNQKWAEDDTKNKIENLLIRAAKLEGENRVLLAEKYGINST